MQNSKKRSSLIPWIAAFFLSACASGYLKYEKASDLKKNDEFDSVVKIEAPEAVDEATKASEATAPTPTPTPTPEPAKSKKEKTKKKSVKETKEAAKVSGDPSKHEPELEGQSGFYGRRPVKDPFRVGEKVTHNVNYFNVTAGNLTLQVKPYAQVNGRKHYHFQTSIKTSSLFSSFYEVDDYVTSMLDFDKVIPSVFTLHVKETSQLREARFFIDWNKSQASYWEKKVTKKDGPEEKKLQWEVPAFTQDVFSSVYYMRVFNWEIGKENAFRVADNGENLIFRAKAIRKEKISIDAGQFNAIVIKPEVELRGQFKPVGDIFIWLSDDDRKYILKIESKIKIGTIVSEASQIVPGQQD